MKRTSLYDFHAANGKVVEFAGYEMPIWYSSITEEHLAVRNRSGIFDVSHMGRVVVGGAGATQFIEGLVPTFSSSQPAGKSFYTLLLNSGGGIIDDIIIIKRPDDYLLVVNAANRAKDLEHIRDLSGPSGVSIEDITDGTTMIAVQGPEAIQALQPLSAVDLTQIKRFTHARSRVGKSDATITRTGYTGEDGFEIILYDSGVEDSSLAASIWGDLATRATPCGLGARDSLRIEAGLPLYGSDIDETTNPIEAELSWVISKGKAGYVGDEAIARYGATQPQRLRRGIVMADKIPRHGFVITDPADRRIGEITSGTFSPLLRKGIAMGYIDAADSQLGGTVQVVVRGSPSQGKIVKPPFYDETMYGWKRRTR
ncbi:MAG: glycine cleavage system aminomethyltransferase GcvT [Thaumarchaeota archaeon]|nr:glycine cleavage system aminomethyltransferase GcvT [Nitrososphaerota archaeon]